MNYKVPESVAEANEWLKRVGADQKGYNFKKEEDLYYIYKYSISLGSSKYIYDLVNVTSDQFSIQRDWNRPKDFQELLLDRKIQLIYELSDFTS